MFAKEEGVPVDAAALAQRVASAVEEVVQKQAQAGIDVIDDGEMSKPSYATYIKDRLSGFGGRATRSSTRISSTSPTSRSACSATPGVRAGRRRHATRRSACAIRRRRRPT
jgi:5-methyltetrahydropteroyltriglutamate--homocysteine methyltransferase